MSLIPRFLLAMCLLLSCANSWSWDATSHRLSAYVAWDLMADEIRDEIIALIQAHPRYQQDFLDAMPVSALVADEEEQARWLFGQAAVWPDLIRNSEIPEGRLFTRPNWHWLDGRWVRNGTLQGNVYVGLISLGDIQGIPASDVNSENDASNLMLAIDWNLKVLNSPLATRAERSVALCWVAHLISDLHQPLHTGALLSIERFPNGDGGGNGIPILGGNLHNMWDQALRNQPFDDTLSRLSAEAAQTPMSTIILDTSLWLAESRQIMQETVYPDEIKAAVLRSERRDQRLRSLSLDGDYGAQMRAIAEDRLSAAGLRLAAQLRASLAK
jgi:hypothetical protein